MFIGKNIRLRALEPSDIAIMYEWENDTQHWKFGSLRTLVSKNALRTMVENAHFSIFEVEQQRFMIETLDGNRIGVTDLFHFDFFHSRIELGILLCSSAQNQGYGKETVRLIEEYVFNFLSIHQLVVEITEDNIACISLFEKSGYHRAGIMKEWVRRGDRYFDIHFYQKISDR